MKACFFGGVGLDVCPKRVTRVPWWWAIMAAGAVLLCVAGGCGSDMTHRGVGDGGLAGVDLGTGFGFRDASTVPRDDSSSSRTDTGRGDADLSDGGSGEDASTPPVCGDETCETAEEDSGPQDCATDCGGQCCGGEELCHDGKTCAVPISGTTIIFATRDEHDGKLGGRPGADNICRSDLPAGLSCGPPMALLSGRAGDSVAALSSRRLGAARRLYAYDRGTNGLTLLANDWSHALNAYGSSAPGLHATLLQGTGTAFGSGSNFWSGSQVDGSRQPDESCGSGCIIDHTCNSWTTNVAMGSTNYYGTQGDAASTKKWLHASSNYAGCSNKMRLLCACRRP